MTKSAATVARHTARTITKMKAWCLANYEKGADTMVECWETEDYTRMINGCNGDLKEAWAVLRRVASVYAERQADARNSAF